MSAWGVSAPGGGRLLWGICTGGGGLLPGGCLLWGVSAPGGLVSQHALRQTPPQERQLLLWTVRILLECIPVISDFMKITWPKGEWML